MTNKQRRILEDAEISSELMHEVDHYLKDVGAVLSGTIHEKENYLTMLCNDIAEFVDVNPSASINNIIGEFGTPEKHADVFLENKMKDKPETIRKRLVFHRVIAIALKRLLFQSCLYFTRVWPKGKAFVKIKISRCPEISGVIK